MLSHVGFKHLGDAVAFVFIRDEGGLEGACRSGHGDVVNEVEVK